MKEYLEAGIIRNVHGVRGDMTVECLCDSPEIFAALRTLYLKVGTGYRAFDCSRNQSFGRDTMLIHLSGVESREEAAAYKNRSLYAARADLPALAEGSYYIADLIGLPVYDVASGEHYGKITDVQNYGASDLYEIESPDGKHHLVPAVPEFVRSVDPERGIALAPIEGMLS